jgi:hypothetical protein
VSDEAMTQVATEEMVAKLIAEWDNSENVAARQAAREAEQAPPASGEDKPYDPFGDSDPTHEQAEGFGVLEREALDAARPGWEARVAAKHAAEQAWAQAQAERAEEAARVEHESKMKSDPEYRAAAKAMAVGQQAVTRWTSLTDQQRAEAAAESGLLARQRGVVGDNQAAEIERRIGFTDEMRGQLEQIERRLVPCPDPRSWGAGVVNVPGRSGELEPHVLEPAGGFTPHEKQILGLTPRSEQSLS